MWWNIIKESRQTSRTMGSIDWEKETIPEKDEPKCKEKLVAIQKALQLWMPPNSKYHGGKHTRGSNVSTGYLYQDKNNSKPELGFKSNGEWLQNDKDNGEPHDYCTMMVQYDTHWMKDITEKEACDFLESLKRLDFNTNNEGHRDGLLLFTTHTTEEASWLPHLHIYYGPPSEKETFYRLTVGENDKKYAQSTIQELRAFIKQQL